MIIWLASFPKSGNTFLRAMLSAYFLTPDGIYQENSLLKIGQFPDMNLFEKYGVDKSSDLEFVKNYLNIQKKMNSISGKKIRFLKTHSSFLDINGYNFTDFENTLGVIYIVRDPRTVVKSYANHYQKSLEEVANRISKFVTIQDEIQLNGKKENRIVYHVGSWSDNYQSWKVLKKFNKYFLIKYEDLVNDTENTFVKVLSFISKLCNSRFVLDKTKLKNTIKSTSFGTMQRVEKDKGFAEAMTGKDGKKITFFKYGPENNNLSLISKTVKEQIEKNFKNELEELNYL
jgi:hypothetical protein